MIIKYKEKQIVVFSDTHGKHRKLPLIKADFVLHLGDACTFDNVTEFDDFLDWFRSYPARYKIFVAGNHEIQWVQQPNEFLNAFPNDCIFLENRIMKLEGITFASVPARYALQQKSKLKLTNTIDFLLTHAPPKDILDYNLGCSNLAAFVNKIKPVYHLFGHIHETGGLSLQQNNTTFCNVSVYYQLVNLNKVN